jgi:F0F1-type ATP synthase alpha subunit
VALTAFRSVLFAAGFVWQEAVSQRSLGFVWARSSTTPTTGILSLDALVPVGLGQRELVVGDRRTGKTSVSLDTIIAQEGAGMVCVFASIGQRAAALLGLAFSLFSRSLTDFLLFVAAFSFDSRRPSSVTAFPVIETLAGDVSSYISTNVISITDGQIFMAMELFAADRRPPVDLTLSVTRVGSAAQWAGVKALCGSYKVQLSQYFELAAFSQFSSDLGADTLRALKRGRLLVALLKQGCGCPMRMWEELLVLGVSRWGASPSGSHLASAMLFLRLAPEWLAVTVSARLLVGAACSP